MFNPYVKAIIGALVALVAGLSVAVEDGHITHSEIVIAIVAGVVGLGSVWASHPLIKWIMGAVVAAASAFGTAVLDDHVTYAEWITIAAAALGAAAAIYMSANTKAVDYKTIDP